MTKVLNAAMVTAADELLSSLGITQQRSVAAPAMGSFAAGVFIGAAAALLLAPSSGEELISKITTRAKALRDAVMTSVTNGAGSEIDSMDKSNRSRSQPGKYAAVQG